MQTLEGHHLGTPGRSDGSSPKRKQAIRAMFTRRSIRGGRAQGAPLHRLNGRWPRTHDPGVRELTVMFTDIAGFTRLAEALPPTAVAQLLASHFRSLAACVERERGRIDKVVGDGLIAFWDGPAAHPAPTAPALRAALRIRAAVEADNAARVGRGQTPIRLRIGLHAGPLVMARLGAAGRLGVTLCGDTINVAQRLEDAARDVPASTDVTIVASDAVVARAGGGFGFEQLGELPVRGRREPVRAFHVAQQQLPS